MVSSIQDLQDLLHDMLTVSEQQHYQKTQSHDSAQTVEKIHQLLNIQHQFKEQVEGNILLQMASAQRFFTFDNHTLEALPKQFDEIMQLLKTGKPFNYQKMYNRHVINVAFPTSSGLPFLFSIRAPTLIYANGKLQLQMTKPTKSIQANMEMEMGYTTRCQAKISFITPFDHMRYIAGHDRNFQMMLPMKAELDLDLQTRHAKLEIKPLDENKEYKILHTSAWPYIAKHDILDFEPVSENKNTQIIHIREPQKIEKQFGDKLRFRIEGQSEEKFLDFNMIYEKIKEHDFVSAFVYPTEEETIENSQYDLIFDAPRSSSKSIILTAAYDQLDRQQEAQQDSSSNRASPSSNTVDSQTRRQEFLRRVKSGIKESSSSVVDLGVQFQGQKSAQYVATVAWASSPVDEKSSLIAYFRRADNEEKHEICLDARSRIPEVPVVDFHQALQQEPKIHVEAKVNYGEKCQTGSKMTLTGRLERSQERKEYLQKQSQSKQCEKEMTNENQLLSGCRNATFNANLLDKYSFTVEYDELSKQVKNMTYQVYSFLRYLGYPYVSENPIVEDQQQSRKLELDVSFRPDLTSADVHVSSPYGNMQFHNIRVNKYARTLSVVHPTMNVAQRIGWSSTRQQQNGKYYMNQIDKLSVFFLRQFV